MSDFDPKQTCQTPAIARPMILEQLSRDVRVRLIGGSYFHDTEFRCAAERTIREARLRGLEAEVAALEAPPAPNPEPQ